MLVELEKLLKEYSEKTHRYKFTIDEIMDVARSIKSKNVKGIIVKDTQLDFDSWRDYIGHIPSKRLVKLIYDDGGSYERNTYWQRSYFVKDVLPSGVTIHLSKDSSASECNNIFSLKANLTHLISMYKARTTKLHEKLFLKHFIFQYISTFTGYENGGHIMTQILHILDITLNGSNAIGHLNQLLFVYYWTMTEQLGIPWSEVIESVKRYSQKSQLFLKYSEKIKTVIPFNEKYNKNHGWYKKINTFTDKELELSKEVFVTVIIDKFWNFKKFHVCPKYGDSTINMYKDKWVDLHPILGVIKN